MAESEAGYEFFGEESHGNISTGETENPGEENSQDDGSGTQEPYDVEAGTSGKGTADGGDGSGDAQASGSQDGSGTGEDAAKEPESAPQGEGPLSGDEIRAVIKENPWMGQLKGETLKNRQLVEELKQYKSFDEALHASRNQTRTEVSNPSDYELSGDYAEQIDPAFNDFFRNAAANAGITKEAAESFYNQYGAFFRQRYNQILEDQKEDRIRAEAELTKEFGGTRQFKEALSDMRGAVMELGGEDVRGLTKDYSLENDGRWIKLLVKIGQMTKEGQFVPGSQSTTVDRESAMVYGDEFKKIAGE